MKIATNLTTSISVRPRAEKENIRTTPFCQTILVLKLPSSFPHNAYVGGEKARQFQNLTEWSRS